LRGDASPGAARRRLVTIAPKNRTLTGLVHIDIMRNSKVGSRNDALREGAAAAYLHASRRGIPLRHFGSMKNVTQPPSHLRFRGDLSVRTAGTRRFPARHDGAGDLLGLAARRSRGMPAVRAPQIKRNSARHRSQRGARLRRHSFTGDATKGQAIVFCRQGIERRSEARKGISRRLAWRTPTFSLLS
jgi:hypothetical protein